MKFNNKYIFGFLLVIFYLAIEVSGSYISNYLFPPNEIKLVTDKTETKNYSLAKRTLRDSETITAIEKQVENFQARTYEDVPPPLCSQDNSTMCFGQKKTEEYRYTGHLLNNLPHGSGEIVYISDNSKYIGNFKNGLEDGYGASFDEYNRIIYDGDWLEGEWSGEGIYYLEQQYYKGYFKNGLYDGIGTYFYGDRTYTGEWIEGNRHGNGKEEYPNGTIYEGIYENGSLVRGKHISGTDGSIYVGDFFYNDYHGDGVFTFEGGDRYVGGYKFGEYHGQGKYTYANPDGTTTVYESGFKHGAMHGKYKITFPDGETHTGSHKTGLRDGRWEFIFASGQRRIQNYKNGIFHGTNTNIFVNGDTEIIDYSDGYKVSSSYKFSNGAERICSFKDGLKDGSCIYTDKDYIEVCNYKMGKFEGCTVE